MGRKENEPPLEPNLRTLQEHEVKTVQASCDFAIDLFHQLSKRKEINQFYSPFSIHAALSMTMNGNDGEALQQYLDVLRFEGGALEQANSGARELTDFLLQVDPKVKMRIANALWHRQDYVVKAPFKSIAEDYYHAKIAGIDVFDPRSVHLINEWIEQKTEGMINEILDQVSPDAVMYLVNAIYYKADWKFQFDARKTEKAPFYLAADREVQVSMMNFKDAGTIKSYRGQNYQYIEIPYSTGQYSMGVLLPDGFELDQINEQLTAENLRLWRSEATNINVKLKMPKFKLKQKFKNLKEDLIAMGLRAPFYFDSRNFTLLFDHPTNLLKIERVIHDAMIEVDERGSEAAAATLVEIVELASSLPSGPGTLALDRPFIFFIQEKHSGTILFMGRLGDPSVLEQDS